jgi:putative membrane protein
MKTKIFSLMIMGGAIALASCQDTSDGTRADGDSTAIERGPDNTRVDDNMDTTSGAMGMESSLDNNTRDFVIEAASGGMMEVELGQLAQQQATHQRVKEFGAMMVRDHSQANNELKAAVSGKANIPATLTDKHQRHINNLREKTGAEFDKDYIKMMVDDHEADIKKFEDIAKETNDPSVREFASKQIPTLKKHLSEAKSIRDELKNK